MQLAPPEDLTPLRIRVKLFGADKRDFEDFLAYYESVYGAPIENEDLLTQLAAFAMHSDREFLKWQKTVSEKKTA